MCVLGNFCFSERVNESVLIGKVIVCDNFHLVDVGGVQELNFLMIIFLIMVSSQFGVLLGDKLACLVDCIYYIVVTTLL